MAPRVGHSGFERRERELQQRTSSGPEHVRRELGRVAVALLLHGQDLQLVCLEAGGREIHDLDRVERDRQRADADLQRRGGFRGHASARKVLDCQAQDRQGLVDR